MDRSFRIRCLGWSAWACWVTATIICQSPARAQETAGADLYAARCVRCHGSQGAGTAEHPQRLEGTHSVAQLASLIRETMPEDDPGTLSASESQAVARYIHDSFYSAVARQRNRPARIELARLTVRQYRSTVADLVGSFGPPSLTAREARGLQAEYYRGRRIGGRRDLAVERVDPQVAFDFDTAAPVPEIKEPHQFSIRWDGSVLAQETGVYDFVVRTEHAARLWINGDERPAIDAWVKSGDDTEFACSMFLLGGRAYPLRLEFTKAKQGVDDSKKQKKPPKSQPASITLLWKRPAGVLSPIPTRNLVPQRAPQSYVCATPFPPDDRSYGWVRGTSISKAWDQATTAAAIETAGDVARHINRLAGTRDDANDRQEKLQAFCRTFASRAFRRPLVEPEQERYIARQFAASADPDVALKRTLLLVLKSPRFLFREVDAGGEPSSDQHHIAARLAYGLWDSIPDEALQQAATAGQLTTPEQVARQAERMLADPRARAKLREFLLTWLQLETPRDLQKDADAFPGFNAQIAADLRTSLELFLDDVLDSPGADYRQLLLADEVFLNDRLAGIYGSEATPGKEFSKVALDDGQRAGIVTHPYLMANFAYQRESSPIHRGVFLVRGVLGQTLRPPPESFVPLAAELHPDLTNRQRVSLQTKPPSCMTCHGMINPLGFTLERFDAIGRYREKDREQPIDDAGSYQDQDGQRVTLRGARELAEFLAHSEQSQRAFVEQLLHHLVQQPARAYGPTALDQLQQSFRTHEFNIRKLAIDVMVTTATMGRDREVAVGPDPDEPQPSSPDN